MIGNEDWDEPQLFLVETTQVIRRQLAILVLPLVLIVATFAVVEISAKGKSQLADTREHSTIAALH